MTQGSWGQITSGSWGQITDFSNISKNCDLTRIAYILPYTNAAWEKLSIFLTFLVPKLPAPKEEDLAKGILEAIDMDSYRAEKKAALKIMLGDQDSEIGPVPTTGGGRKTEPELDRLSNILKTFNENFGTLFTDGDRVIRRIKDDIAPKVGSQGVLGSDHRFL